MKFRNIIFILILSLNCSTEVFSAPPNYTKEYKKLVKRFPKAIKNKRGCLKYTQELYAFVARLNSRRHDLVDEIGYEHIAGNKEVEALYELRLKALRICNFAEMLSDDFGVSFKIKDIQLVKKEVNYTLKLMYENLADNIKVYEIRISGTALKTYLAYNTNPNKSMRLYIDFDGEKSGQKSNYGFGFRIDCASAFGFCRLHDKCLNYDFSKYNIAHKISHIGVCD